MSEIYRLRVLVPREVTPTIVQLMGDDKEAFESLSEISREIGFFSQIDNLPGESRGVVSMKIRVVVSVEETPDCDPVSVLHRVDSGELLTVDVTCPEGTIDDNFKQEFRNFLKLAVVQ